MGAPAVVAAACVAALPALAAPAARPDSGCGVPPGAFVTALARDPRGDLWAATEDLGLFRLPAPAGSPGPAERFTAKTGLSDDTACALAVDRAGRLWVGTLNHGVSVWNGESWRHYDILDGPLGERVFDLACNPVDGDVWIATSAGLTRYEAGRDRWRHYTRNDGLPSDHAAALAFDRRGTLYVGTQCHGVAFARATPVNGVLEYYAWAVAAAPDRFGPGGVSPVPLEPSGAGLPSSLVNDVCVGRDGTVWAATTAGLAWSRNGGTTWQYLRGRDWEAKIRGLLGGAPAGWRPRAGAAGPGLLPEDRVTCLAEDGQGLIWMGHWRQGWSVIHPRTLQILGRSADGDARDYAFAIQPVPGGTPWIAWYGGGLTRAELRADDPVRLRPAAPADTAASDPPVSPAADGLPLRSFAGSAPRHPSPAAPPAEPGIRALLRRIEQAVDAGRRGPDPPRVTALPDDWRTQGEWLGRYGRYWACLCAMVAPGDYTWGAGPRHVPYCAVLGRHRAVGDGLRYWVHWLQTTNPRSLEIPPTYMHSRVVKGYATWEQNRRQSEWDDHGEAYPMTMDGPDLFFNIEVPEGLFALSLYDFNKDGHTGMNRFRDYHVLVKAFPPGRNLHMWCTWDNQSYLNGLDEQPVLERFRIRHFWGGAYKRLLVRGPAPLTVKIVRNYSFNTILCGVFLDLLEERPDPYFPPPKARVAPAGEGDRTVPEPPPPVEDRLLAALEDPSVQGLPWWASGSREAYGALLRGWTEKGAQPPRDRAARWAAMGLACYRLGLFAEWEAYLQRQGLRTSRSIEKAVRWDGTSASCRGAGRFFVEGVVRNPEPSQQKEGDR